MIEAEVDPMSYIPLTKVYYQSPDEYEEEWRRRRENPFSSYHIPFQIGEYPVFFLQLPELYQSIIELHRLDQKIHLLYFGLPKMAIQNFTLHSLIGEIVITNQFEGVSSSRRFVLCVRRPLIRCSCFPFMHSLKNVTQPPYMCWRQMDFKERNLESCICLKSISEGIGSR